MGNPPARPHLQRRAKRFTNSSLKLSSVGWVFPVINVIADVDSDGAVCRWLTELRALGRKTGATSCPASARILPSFEVVRKVQLRFLDRHAVPLFCKTPGASAYCLHDAAACARHSSSRRADLQLARLCAARREPRAAEGAKGASINSRHRRPEAVTLPCGSGGCEGVVSRGLRHIRRPPWPRSAVRETLGPRANGPQAEKNTHRNGKGAPNAQDIDVDLTRARGFQRLWTFIVFLRARGPQGLWTQILYTSGAHPDTT